DIRVAVLEQQDQDRELFLGSGSQRPFRGQQPHVTRHLAAFEEIEKRSRSGHGGARYVLKLFGFNRTVTTSPAFPSGFARAPFSVTVSAPAFPAVTTKVRVMSNV